MHTNHSEAALQYVQRDRLSDILTNILKNNPSLLLEAQRTYMRQSRIVASEFEGLASPHDLASVDDLPSIDGFR